MNCFKHHSSSAVGICKSCGKGLCRACAADTGVGLACLNSCEDNVAILGRMISNNARVMRAADAQVRSSALFGVVMGAAFLGFAWWSYNGGNVFLAIVFGVFGLPFAPLRPAETDDRAVSEARRVTGQVGNRIRPDLNSSHSATDAHGGTRIEAQSPSADVGMWSLGDLAIAKASRTSVHFGKGTTTHFVRIRETQMLTGRCAACNAEGTFAASLAGLKLRCKHCSDGWVTLAADPASPPAAAAHGAAPTPAPPARAKTAPPTIPPPATPNPTPRPAAPSTRT